MTGRVEKALTMGLALAVVSVAGGVSQGDPEHPDVVVAERATKIAQLVGEWDRQRGEPTLNRTWSRRRLRGTDLGVPFRHDGRTWLVFGDTHGPPGGDALAWTTDTTPEDGIELHFVHGEDGTYLPVRIPGVGQGAFEVPMEGTSHGGRMYIYHTTDHSRQTTMGRCVVAVGEEGAPNRFRYLYDLSTKHFINVSVVKAAASDWPGLPVEDGEVLVMFGSGEYRRSDVRLACQPAGDIESGRAIRYFAGTDDSDRPTWSRREEDARPLFHQPCVGELSVTYNRHVDRWIMLYNAAPPHRGINVRTARRPWGPWSEPQVLFNAWREGYGLFMHAPGTGDGLHDPGREDVWGGEYGPYQFGHLAAGGDRRTTIYFTMSTWNPYTVVLMKAMLALRAEPEQ